MTATKSLIYWTLTGVCIALVTGVTPNEDLAIASLVPQLLTSLEALPSKAAQPTLAQSSGNLQLLPGQTNCKNLQTQAAIANCAILFSQASNKKLNQIYQQLRASLKGSQREKLLVDAQLAWISFRDANCTFEKSRFEGGSIATTIYYGCIDEMTKQRANKLENYLQKR
jgi:uncharacterized protein YecT (DUF1311 family)